MTETRKWYTFSGNEITNIQKEIIKNISEETSEGKEIMIGTDSQVKGKYVKYVTMIVIKNGLNGAVAYYSPMKIDNLNRIDIQNRMITEVGYSIEIAEFLNPILKKYNHDIKEIHVDVNKNPEHKSSLALKTCQGYVRGMGYEIKTKPDAYVASTVADAKCKG